MLLADFHLVTFGPSPAAAGPVAKSFWDYPVVAAIAGGLLTAAAALVTYHLTQRAQARKERVAVLSAKLEGLYLAAQKLHQAVIGACQLPGKGAASELLSAASDLLVRRFEMEMLVYLYIPQVGSEFEGMKRTLDEVVGWLRNSTVTEGRAKEGGGRAGAAGPVSARPPGFDKSFTDDVQLLYRGLERAAVYLAQGRIPPARGPAQSLPGDVREATPLGRILAAFLTPSVRSDRELAKIYREIRAIEVADGMGWNSAKRAKERGELDALAKHLATRPPSEGIMSRELEQHLTKLLHRLRGKGLDAKLEQLVEIQRRRRAAAVRFKVLLLALFLLLSLLAMAASLGWHLAKP